MTTKQEYVFYGRIQWAMNLFEKTKWGDYRVKFYPKDNETRKAIRATGTQANVKEDDDGFYYTFKNDIQPPVTDDQGNPIEGIIGNNSEAAIKLLAEKFTSPKYGEVTRTKLLGVVVTKLIPYVKPEAAAEIPPADVAPVLPA